MMGFQRNSKCLLFLCCVIVSSSVVSGQSESSSRKLKRGEACDNENRLLLSSSSNINPKFKVSRSDGNQMCDDGKGLICTQSEDPEFKQDAFESGPSGKLCDCEEDYYFDAKSGECRILVGLACDPSKSEGGESTWKDKCPEDAFCSQDLGRYGPRNAKGMCRCKPGFYVNSFWFAHSPNTLNGGGVICENPEEETKRQKERMEAESMDYPNANSLA